MFTASRILYGLGLRGLAPRWVSYCTKGGIPIAALGVCVCGSSIDVCLRDSNALRFSLASLGWLSWPSGAGLQRFSREFLFSSGYRLWRICSLNLIQKLVHRHRDSWCFHRLVDYQLDLHPLL